MSKKKFLSLSIALLLLLTGLLTACGGAANNATTTATAAAATSASAEEATSAASSEDSTTAVATTTAAATAAPTAATTTAAATTAATTAEAAAPSVELKWLMANVGPDPADGPEVWAMINEKLQDYMPGVTLSITCVPFGEYDQRWMLEAASGATWDLAWFGWMLNLANEVNNGALTPLSSLVDQYAPVLYDELPQFMFDCNTVRGQLYLIPCNQIAATPATGIRIPTDLAEKYLDRPALEAAAQEWADSDLLFPPSSLLDAVEDFAQKCKDAGELQLGLAMGNLNTYIGPRNYWYAAGGGGGGWTNYAAYCKALDNTCKAYSYADFADEARAYMLRMREWNEKGFVRKDALTVTDWGIDFEYYLEGNGYAMTAHNYDKYNEESESARYGFPITVIPVLYAKAPIGVNPTNTALSVMSGAKNPERAVEFLGFLNSKPGVEIYNMLVFGIEGKHWEFTDKSAELIETFGYTGQVTPDEPYGIPKWVVGNTYYCYTPQGTDPEYDKYMCSEFNMTAMPMPLSGFVFDTQDLLTETTAWLDINKEYKDGFAFGTYADVNKTFDEYLSRLEAAGCANFAVEMQKQIDVFLAK